MTFDFNHVIHCSLLVTSVFVVARLVNFESIICIVKVKSTEFCDSGLAEFCADLPGTLAQNLVCFAESAYSTKFKQNLLRAFCLAEWNLVSK